MIKIRKFEKGGIYHIIKRGVGHQEVFKDKQDYSRCSLSLELCNNQESINLWETFAKDTFGSLKERIQAAREKKGKLLCKLLAFTLMPTHVHLIVQEIIDGGISDFMRKLGGYSFYFNQRHNRGGPLFRRYKLVPIKTDEQLHIVFAYVHTNPISLWEPNWKEYQVKNKDKALKKLKDYFWTSYGTYIGQEKFLNTIDRDFYLDFFGSKKKCKQVVENWVDYKGAEIGPQESKFE